MRHLDTSKLSTQEIVESFFTEIDIAPYSYDFVHRLDTPLEIRKYIEKNEIGQIQLDKFVQLSYFEKNGAICELIDDALCAWSAAFLQDGETSLFTLSGITYLSEITYLVSREHKRRYGSSNKNPTDNRGDWMLIDRLRGTKHLSFLAKHLNEHFKDPEYIEQWNLAFAHCFRKRSTPIDPPIAALFCRYMLESENDDPQLPFYADECETAFKLNLPVIRFICINGLTAIRHTLWEENIYGHAEFAFTLYNITKAIWRYQLYEDFNENDRERFKDMLILYPCFGAWADMQNFLKDGDAEFVRLSISAWSEFFEKGERTFAEKQRRDNLGWAKFLETPHELVIAGREMSEHLPRLRSFLLSIPPSEVTACQSEWGEMQIYISEE